MSSTTNEAGGEYVPMDLPQFSAPPPDVVPALIALGDQLTARWNFPAALGTPVASPGGTGTAASVTFGFLTAASQQMNEEGYTGFSPLTASQQTGLRAALAAWGEVARLTFTETAGASADIRIARVDQAGGGGFAYYPSFGYSFNGGGIITAVNASPIGGDIFIGTSATTDMAVGSFGYQLALHESGHAIGLKHPFEDPPTLPAATDSLRYTVMSYTAAPHAGTVDVTGTSGGYSWTTYDLQPRTPMLYDIAAAQHLYGANTTTRAGNDSYSWGVSERFLMTIWDGGGADTIDASNQTLASTIDLRDGAFSSIGIRATQAELRLGIPAFATAVPTPSYDGRDNLAIAFGAVIENAVGGAGNDWLIGNDVGNRLTGGGGADILDGGSGADTMLGGMGDDQFLLDNALDVTTELDGEGTETAWINALIAPTLGAHVEIGRLYGTGAGVNAGSTATQLVANAAIASTLQGGAGADVLWGSALNNVMSGGGGDDIIRAQGGGGTFSGGPGNDQFVVSALGTILVENPDEGIDTAWVTVSGYTISAHIEITRLGGTATSVTGSGTDEQLVANPSAGSNVDGGGGHDILWGGGFADTLNGGMGDDILRGQGGADVFIGGMGNDQFVVVDAGITVSENSSQGYDTAWVAVDGWVLPAEVERANLSGTAGSITGNGLDNVIVGNAGFANTALLGGTGHDTIFGGAFDDLFRGDAGDDVLYSQGGADRFVYQGAGWGNDQISGWVAGQAKLVFTGSGISFGQLSFNSAGGNTQVSFGASAILVFGASGLGAGDFIF